VKFPDISPTLCRTPTNLVLLLLGRITHTMYVDVAYSYRLSSHRVSSVVCHNCEPWKNGWTNPDAVWVEDSGEPRKPCIRWGSRSRMRRDNFEGGGAAHCKVYGHTAVSCAETAEPIKMPFGLRTWWVVPMNHDVQIPLWEGAILRGKKGGPL